MTEPITEDVERPADAPPEPGCRPMRADARRNHDRILAEARRAVDEQGAEVTLEDVARRAGVGIGTLYRHFPTRDALFEAAFTDEVRELRDRAEALSDADEPLEALVAWLRLQVVLGAHGRCMGAVVMNAKRQEGSELHTCYTGMREAGTVLLRRAQEAGRVRAEVDLIDVLRMVHGILMATEQAAEPEQRERLFDLLVAGIRSS